MEKDDFCRVSCKDKKFFMQISLVFKLVTQICHVNRKLLSFESAFCMNGA